MYSIVAKTFSSWLRLLLSNEEVGGDMLRTFKNWECRENTNLFLLRVNSSTCVSRALGIRPQPQALFRDCKRSWNKRLVYDNERDFFQNNNSLQILHEFCCRTNL